MFTIADIVEATDHFNFNKGIGPDTFDGMILKKNKDIKIKIANEIKEMMNVGFIPDHLKGARLVPLTKVKG